TEYNGCLVLQVYAICQGMMETKLSLKSKSSEQQYRNGDDRHDQREKGCSPENAAHGVEPTPSTQQLCGLARLWIQRRIEQSLVGRKDHDQREGNDGAEQYRAEQTE